MAPPGDVTPTSVVNRPDQGSFWRIQVPAILALLVLGSILAILLVSGTTGTQTVDLDGPWQTTHGPVELPGLLTSSGLQPDARVRASRELPASDQVLAVWVSSPAYAISILHDGVRIAGRGDPNSSLASARSTASVLAVLPTSETPRQLTLDLKGDYGRGGITGRIVVGPYQEVVAVSIRSEILRLATAFGLCMLAALPLLVASTTRWKPGFLFYGLFVLHLAAMLIAQSDLAGSSMDAIWNLRIRRFVVPPIGATVVAFAAAYVYGRPRPTEQALLAGAYLLGLIGLLAPPFALRSLELGGDTLQGVCWAWYAIITLDGTRQKIRGAAWLAAAMAPMALALGSEVLASNGMAVPRGDSPMFLLTLLFAVAIGAALVVRDAETTQRFSRLIAGSKDGMVTVLAGGTIQDANPASSQLLPRALASGNILSAVHADDRPLFRAHLQRGQKRPERIEFRILHSDKTYESQVTALDPKVLLLTVRDVTESKEMSKSMLAAARMETMGLLLGGLAHDFNNMLGTLLAHLGLLQATEPPDAPLQLRLTKMEQTVNRASQLTRKLLTVARGSSSELVALDATEVVKSAIELVEPTLPVGMKLRAKLPSGPMLAWGNREDLEQVVVNLLVNARDALGGQGSIQLTLQSFEHEEAGRGVLLVVEDDGPGLPAGLDVFQPFVSTKSSGTGLGLAVAAQIVHDHHGRLWHEPRALRGARFLLALRTADAPHSAPAPMPDGRRIVVVDDESVLAEEYRRALAAAGYDVVAFNDPIEASRYLVGARPDLLVTDVAMDGLHGIELARQCQAHHPGCPVLIVSALIPEHIDLAEGTWDTLHKPVRAEQLVDLVGRIRRRAERAAIDELDITRRVFLFAPLDPLTGPSMGFE